MAHLMRMLVAACMLAGTAMASGGIPELMIEGISPRDIASDTSFGDNARPTTGLPTVNPGMEVYLTAHNDTATTWSWSVEAVPTESGVALGEFATTMDAIFVPDTVGSFDIGLVIDGGTMITQTITAAWYVGVGTNAGGTADLLAGECGACHSRQNAGWRTTAHSDAMERKVDVLRGAYCLPCHSVGYETTMYVTGGLDSTSGFAWPDSGWTADTRDSVMTNFPDQANYMNIQCESCHGPGGEHRSKTDKNQISYSWSSDVCAVCHNAGTHHYFPLEWESSAHAKYSDITGDGHASRASCTRCHTAQGYVNETVNGGAAAAYDEPHPITCAACHDPHEGSGEHQLRAGSTGDACIGCHTLRISGYSGLHHSHQGPMLMGEDGMEAPGYDYPDGAHTDIEDRCAECHMAHAPAYLHDAFADSGIAAAQQVMGGHTFRVAGVIDTALAEAAGLTPGAVLNDEGCIDCHGEVSLEFVELSQAKVHDLMDELLALVPVYPDSVRRGGEPVLPANDSMSVAEEMSAFNWTFVNNDGSYGVHNMPYTIALLKSSISEIMASQATGEIDEIVDVPNDQGGMVRVIWNAFDAEDAGMATVTEYGVWRHDPDNDVWVFVGSVPATKQMRYGLDVATDYDSTEEDGAVWSHFKVSGTTTNPKVVLWTEPAMGYSFDNIAPEPPGQAKLVANQLVWAPSKSEDVRYYAVYRAPYRGSTPFGEPLMTTVDTTVAAEWPYKYGIAAVDYGGNVSTIVPKLVPTGVSEGALPTSTALLGNAPNPFNPETVIRYQVHAEARASITVYDVQGRQVRTLITGRVGIGTHSVTWDGRDNTGNEVASGLYVYALTTNTGTRDVRRMLLVR